jgi:hypothetical protein
MNRKKKLVYDFWSSPGASIPTGNKSDIKRMRAGPKQFVSHAVFVLEKTQTEVFLAFMEKKPTVKICQQSFEKL